MMRWTTGVLCCAMLLACGNADCGRRPSELAVLEVANNALGLNVPVLEDATLLEEFADRVVQTWYHSDRCRFREVTASGWAARVQEAGLPVPKGAWVASTSSTVVGISSETGNETSIRTIELVVWFE